MYIKAVPYVHFCIILAKIFIIPPSTKYSRLNIFAKYVALVKI